MRFKKVEEQTEQSNETKQTIAKMKPSQQKIVEYVKSTNMLQNILEDVDNYIVNKVYSDDFIWWNEDKDEAHGFILYTLFNSWTESNKDRDMSKYEEE